MGNELAVEGIFGRFHPAILRHNLCGAHAVVIVDEVDLLGLHFVAKGCGGGDYVGGYAGSEPLVDAGRPYYIILTCLN